MFKICKNMLETDNYMYIRNRTHTGDITQHEICYKNYLKIFSLMPIYLRSMPMLHNIKQHIPYYKYFKICKCSQ